MKRPKTPNGAAAGSRTELARSHARANSVGGSTATEGCRRAHHGATVQTHGKCRSKIGSASSQTSSQAARPLCSPAPAFRPTPGTMQVGACPTRGRRALAPHVRCVVQRAVAPDLHLDHAVCVAPVRARSRARATGRRPARWSLRIRGHDPRRGPAVETRSAREARERRRPAATFVPGRSGAHTRATDPLASDRIHWVPLTAAEIAERVLSAPP